MNRDLFRRDRKTSDRTKVGRRYTPTSEDTSDSAVKVLNQALRVAQLMVLRCKRQYHVALRHRSPPLAGAALEHANEAKLHTDRLAQRILQLGGMPDPSPDALPHQTRADPRAADPLTAEIKEHLVASRAAVESYSEFAAFFAPFDPLTRQLIDEIAAGEQERADDVAHLYDQTARASAPNA